VGLCCADANGDNPHYGRNKEQGIEDLQRVFPPAKARYHVLLPMTSRSCGPAIHQLLPQRWPELKIRGNREIAGMRRSLQPEDQLPLGDAADLTEGGLVVSPNENSRRAEAFRKMIATAPKPGTKTILITHKPNLRSSVPRTAATLSSPGCK
jgi:hypothetical protein